MKYKVYCLSMNFEFNKKAFIIISFFRSSADKFIHDFIDISKWIKRLVNKTFFVFSEQMHMRNKPFYILQLRFEIALIYALASFSLPTRTKVIITWKTFLKLEKKLYLYKFYFFIHMIKIMQLFKKK